MTYFIKAHKGRERENNSYSRKIGEKRKASSNLL
jgi:hypothetical protein